MKIDTLPIDEIKVGERRREDFGDMQGLIDSIAKYGLFHPIVVDNENNLIAGERRLRACQSLEWYEIPCRLYRDLTDDERSEIELEENIRRKDLTPLEQSKNLVRLSQVAENIIQSEFRLADSQKSETKRGRPQEPASKRKVAGRIGFNKQTIANAEQHVAAVEKYPELSVVPTQKEAIAVARALDEMPIAKRTAARSKILSEGRRAIADITHKPTKVKPKSSKYSDNLSQIQTFIKSIKSVGAEELTANWTEIERHNFLSDLRECRDDMTSFISELESIEEELKQAS